MKKVWKIALVIPVVLLLAVLATNQNMPWMSKPVSEAQKEPTVVIDNSPVLDLNAIETYVNNERSQTGVAPLARDELLDKSAQAKCDDMVAKDYWSHNAPDGTQAWYFIRAYNVYNHAGENLAYGYKTENSLVAGWMNSPGHRRNILDSSFMNVGYAQCEYTKTSKQGEATLVVQHFADLP